MSAKIALFPGEQVVMSSDNDVLTLTTKRVRYDSAVFWGGFGSSQLISITLDSVASCGLVTKRYTVLLVLGVLAVIGAFMLGISLFFLVAAVLTVAYFLTGRGVISIASKGGESILVPTKGMGRSSIVEFLEAVEREVLTGAERRERSGVPS